jgi:hypothetical protein
MGHLLPLRSRRSDNNGHLTPWAGSFAAGLGVDLPQIDLPARTRVDLGKIDEAIRQLAVRDRHATGQTTHGSGVWSWSCSLLNECLVY